MRRVFSALHAEFRSPAELESRVKSRGMLGAPGFSEHYPWTAGKDRSSLSCCSATVRPGCLRRAVCGFDKCRRCQMPRHCRAVPARYGFPAARRFRGCKVEEAGASGLPHLANPAGPPLSAGLSGGKGLADAREHLLFEDATGAGGRLLINAIRKRLCALYRRFPRVRVRPRRHKGSVGLAPHGPGAVLPRPYSRGAGIVSDRCRSFQNGVGNNDDSQQRSHPDQA